MEKSRESTTELVDVFSYQDFKAFLKDFYSERRRKDRKFSIRFFARRAGLRSQNYLKVVMDGRRSLTPRNMPKFVKGLGLDANQAEYFEALVNLNQARDSYEKREFLNRLLHLQKKKAAIILSGRQLEFFSEWYHLVIFELACQENFESDPIIISKRLKGKISEIQARESLDLMLNTGILTRSLNGKLVPMATQIASPQGLAMDQIRKLQKVFMEFGIESTIQERGSDVDVRSLTIGLTPEQVPIFKCKLKEFQRELNTLFSTGKGTNIFQMNIQFFKLTKDINEG